MCGYFLVSWESPIDYTAIKILSRPSLRYELFLGTSFAKVYRLEAENGCCRQTDTKKIIYRYVCVCMLYFITYIR